MAKKRLTRQERLNREIKKDTNRLMKNIYKSTGMYDAMKPVRKVNKICKNVNSIFNDIDDLAKMSNRKK